MVLCEDDERRFGGGFLFCVEDFVGGGYAEAGFLGTGRDSGRGSS